MESKVLIPQGKIILQQSLQSVTNASVTSESMNVYTHSLSHTGSVSQVGQVSHLPSDRLSRTDPEPIESLLEQFKISSCHYMTPSDPPDLKMTKDDVATLLGNPGDPPMVACDAAVSETETPVDSSVQLGETAIAAEILEQAKPTPAVRAQEAYAKYVAECQLLGSEPVVACVPPVVHVRVAHTPIPIPPLPVLVAKAKIVKTATRTMLPTPPSLPIVKPLTRKVKRVADKQAVENIPVVKKVKRATAVVCARVAEAEVEAETDTEMLSPCQEVAPPPVVARRKIRTAPTVVEKVDSPVPQPPPTHKPFLPRPGKARQGTVAVRQWGNPENRVHTHTQPCVGVPNKPLYTRLAPPPLTIPVMHEHMTQQRMCDTEWDAGRTCAPARNGWAPQAGSDRRLAVQPQTHTQYGVDARLAQNPHNNQARPALPRTDTHAAPAAEQYHQGGAVYNMESGQQSRLPAFPHNENRSAKMINHAILAMNCVVHSGLQDRSEMRHVFAHDDLCSSAKLVLSRLISFVDKGATLRLGTTVQQWLNRMTPEAHSDAARRAEWIRENVRATAGQVLELQ